MIKLLMYAAIIATSIVLLSIDASLAFACITVAIILRYNPKHLSELEKPAPRVMLPKSVLTPVAPPIPVKPIPKPRLKRKPMFRATAKEHRGKALEIIAQRMLRHGN